jgi:predicted nucleic acid-binding protein
VTRYLLDTSIVSEASKAQPASGVADWVENQADSDLFISTLTIAEIWRGVLEMPSGRRRRNLEAWFAGAEGLSVLFSGRVLPFDEPAAMEWARIMAAGTAAGRPRSPIDMIIASTASVNDASSSPSTSDTFKARSRFLTHRAPRADQRGP